MHAFVYFLLLAMEPTVFQVSFKYILPFVSVIECEVFKNGKGTRARSKK